jgi:hypothetical protein
MQIQAHYSLVVTIFSNGLINRGYYEISGYRHALSTTMRLCGAQLGGC